jgi:hypothetical protein
MTRVILPVLLLGLLLAACTAGPNALTDTPDVDGHVAGFWRGLWHGFFSPFTFVVSLFSDTVEVFEVHNNGGWYMLGFLIGASAIFGGGGGGAARRWRR